MTTQQTGRLCVARSIAFAIAIAVTLSAPCLAQDNQEHNDADFSGDVTGLGILNAADLRQQDVIIGTQQFIQFGGHFDIATLDFGELVGPGAGNIMQMPDGTYKEIAWWDVEVQVTRSPASADRNQGVMISIDKDVTNDTDQLWTDFHMSVGRGLGDAFVESDEFDFLFFKTDPAPVNEVPVTNPVNPVQAFDNPPMQDEPIAPDSLWWFANKKAGLGPGETTDFWLGIAVPANAFEPGSTTTKITLREHASVPEPSTVTLILIGAVAACSLRRRSR